MIGLICAIYSQSLKRTGVPSLTPACWAAATAWQTSRDKSLLLDKQVVSLQKAVESTSLLMEHGTTTYLEVLTAKQNLLSAQLTQTANRFSEIQSVITLYCALGGGQE